MTLKDLLKTWEANASAPLTEREFRVALTQKDAAKIAALAEMYPGRTQEQIITELMTVALAELETTLPYVQGDKVSAFDELGDPIYEDVGPTARFSQLVRKHLEQSPQH